ncbi:MAG: lipoate--protein ligase, partial [Bacteroidales bacterium]|nr:lipoate--protein ligase [Bacteroidales bacterium]
MAFCRFTDLGSLPYREAWALQEAEMEAVKSAKAKGLTGRNRLFFVEHGPVFTVGKNGKADNMLASEALLHDRKAEFIRVDRGGDVTYHGPGQLVV